METILLIAAGALYGFWMYEFHCPRERMRLDEMTREQRICEAQRRARHRI